MKKHSPEGAVFLDRDGVINVDRRDYVKSWVEFKFLPQVFEALRILNKNKLRVIVVTNQSAVNRGLMSIDTLKEIHRKMLAQVEKHSGRIEAIYYCPHTPSEGCECRKPKPGMVLRAVKEHAINLARSYVVGDSERDVELARSLEIKCVRVMEKSPATSSLKNRDWTAKHPIVGKSLREAADYILHDLKTSAHS